MSWTSGRGKGPEARGIVGLGEPRGHQEDGDGLAQGAACGGGLLTHRGQFPVARGDSRRLPPLVELQRRGLGQRALPSRLSRITLCRLRLDRRRVDTVRAGPPPCVRRGRRGRRGGPVDHRLRRWVHVRVDHHILLCERHEAFPGAPRRARGQDRVDLLATPRDWQFGSSARLLPPPRGRSSRGRGFAGWELGPRPPGR